MNFLPSIPYPENERPLLTELGKLFTEWHHYFRTHHKGDERLAEFDPDDMVFDGFYPYYTSKPRRLLFVGWESREISGHNYIDMLCDNYRNDRSSGRSIYGDRFHRRMLYVTYGLLHGMPDWSQVPEAEDIGKTFATPDGISFAFMNLCKLSNEWGPHTADWHTISAFHQLSEKERFFEREVAILKPDFVITMNFESKNLEPFSKHAFIGADGGVAWSSIDLCGHSAFWLDAWHFSAFGPKQDERDFYLPICNAVRQCEALGK
jgi:hypothetical protein